MHALTIFLMSTSCRIQEGLDLDWRDVSLADGRAFVRMTKTNGIS